MRIIISCSPNGVSALLKTNPKLSWLPYHTTTVSQFISWPQTFVAFHTVLSLLVFPANIHTFTSNKAQKGREILQIKINF